jgi:hypothetical protein
MIPKSGHRFSEISCSTNELGFEPTLVGSKFEAVSLHFATPCNTA